MTNGEPNRELLARLATHPAWQEFEKVVAEKWVEPRVRKAMAEAMKPDADPQLCRTLLMQAGIARQIIAEPSEAFAQEYE